ncbi:hypothetical protein LOD99_9899 [Oopsacas minuta]|uniref:Uncharacterized protein n=1 Tax=Oopsacas minuta TaxID=111878 RepID=A0AAV7KJY9_9METZ|nr:hypothetical protein LOD99_9899 [Oopsacas minuta]
MGAGYSSKSSTGSSVPDYDSYESGNETSAMDDLFDLTTCIIQLQRKLEDIDLEASINHAMYPECSTRCKDEKRELQKRLELLTSREQKLFRSIARPKKMERKHSSVIIMHKKKQKLRKKTHYRSMMLPTECRQLTSLDEPYKKFSQQPIPMCGSIRDL